MTEKEAEDLCKMIRVGVDLSKKYQPRTTEELKDLIKELIEKRGNKADLNDIDVSQITDMSRMFANFPQFNGEIFLIGMLVGLRVCMICSMNLNLMEISLSGMLVV